MLPRTGERYELADIERAVADSIPESDLLEYKADPSLYPDGSKLTPEQQLAVFVAKAASAFANAGGGTLVLGLREVGGVPTKTSPPGISATMGRERADARVDSFLSRHVEPRPTSSVTFIDLGSDRAFVTVEVQPRGETPHRIRETADRSLNGRYYVRRGRDSVEADHATLRTLFAEAEAREERVRRYVERYGIGDALSDPEGFARREPSRWLAPGSEYLKTVLCVTAIPEVLRGDVIDTDAADVRALLVSDEIGGPWYQVRPTAEGRMAFTTAGKPPLLKAYAHVHRSGYVEVGYGPVAQSTDQGKIVYANVVAEIVRAAASLTAKLYELVPVRDRVRFGVHLRDAGDSRLGIHAQGMTGYNTQGHVTLESTHRADELATTETYVLFDRRLAQAYGIEKGLILNADGTKIKRMFPLTPD